MKLSEYAELYVEYDQKKSEGLLTSIHNSGIFQPKNITIHNIRNKKNVNIGLTQLEFCHFQIELSW